MTTTYTTAHTPVEVCPVCDIAGCIHIRERRTGYVSQDTHEAALAERDARIAELEGALRAIATYREKCQEYDDDMGHERRDFDGDGWWQIEHGATAALSPPDPMKPLQDAGNG